MRECAFIQTSLILVWIKEYSRVMTTIKGRRLALEAGGNMAESSDIWKLHLVYQLSQRSPGFDEDVLRKVRAIEGVTSVAVVPSSDASTHLAFSTRYANVVVASVGAKQCLQEALDAHNATLWWWQRKVRLMDESAVRKVAYTTFHRF
jgi:hypothetical protein